MNWVDLLLVAVILLAIWAGWRKGFIVGSLDLLTWLGSLMIAFFCYPFISNILDGFFPSLGVWSVPLSFILMIIIARLLLSLITNAVLRLTHRDVHRTQVNHVLGVIPGAVNGVIWAIIVSALMLAMPVWEGVSQNTRDSKIASRLASQAEWIEAQLSPVFDDAVNETINNLTIHPSSNETVELPFTVSAAQARPDLEAEMLILVNKERIKHGLSPLKPDPEMTPVARGHSRDMFARGYFAHLTPEGRSPFDRMKSGGIRYLAAGENLALAQTLSIAHKGLMNSPGHRANILHKSYGRVGIGVLDGGIHGLMITQNFRN